jgi:hypothetical protein
MRLALALALAASGCAVYDAPPEPSLAGATEGLLPDPKQPIVVAFDKPAIPDTIKLEIAPYVPEPPDYDKPPSNVIFAHDPKTGDTGGTSVIAADGTSITITPKFELPAGEELLLVVEPGLSDLAGTMTKVERRIVFGYATNLDCKAPAAVLLPGAYFMIAAITEPIPVRVNLWTMVDVDATTGALKIEWSKAIRDPNAKCPTPCASTDVCQKETGMCVAPSTPATSVDEYPDYVPSPTPPTGFDFGGVGCTVDEGTTTASFATAKFDIVVTSPSVTLRNSSMSASFTLDSTTGVLHGSGSLSADQVLLGTSLVGMGAGQITARSVTSAQAPPGIPGP